MLRTQLDYIFASKGSGLAPEEVTLAMDDSPVPLSDHFGVLARFIVGRFQPQRQAKRVGSRSGARGGQLEQVWGDAHGEASHGEASHGPHVEWGI